MRRSRLSWPRPGSGLSWSADYTCIANPDETTMNLTGFVRVFNRSGEEYENAQVRLVVGTINLVEKIAELVNEKKIEGISHLQDESDKDGMRVVIELKRGEVPEVVLNNLYKQTQLQDSFGINMVALIDGQPRLCNLKQLLEIPASQPFSIVRSRTVR